MLFLFEYDKPENNKVCLKKLAGLHLADKGVTKLLILKNLSELINFYSLCNQGSLMISGGDRLHLIHTNSLKRKSKIKQRP